MSLILGTLRLPDLSVLAISSREGESFAAHDLLEGRRRLQHMGEAPPDVSVSLRLHVEWCDPSAVVESLRTLKRAGEPFAAVTAGGVALGTFVLVDLSQRVQWTFEDGTPGCILADLQLSDPGVDVEPTVRPAGVRDQAEDIVTVTPAEDTSRPIGTVTPGEIARR